MPDNNNSSSGRWKIALLVLALLVPCAVIGGNMVLRNRARQSNTSLQAQEQARADAINARLQLKPEGKKVRLDRAKELRGKWRPWAFAHQIELRRMLQADKNDMGTLMTVWNDVPYVPNVNPLLKDLASAYGVKGNPLDGKVFTWNAIEKPGSSDQVQALSSEEREQHRKVMANLTWNQKRDFKSFRDVVIANSIQTGKTGIALWASGRVTETDHVKTVLTSNEVAVGVIEHKELVPPFDFLTD